MWLQYDMFNKILRITKFNVNEHTLPAVIKTKKPRERPYSYAQKGAVVHTDS